MRFNLETSKLLYEVRYQNTECDESYMFEQLYRDINGRYFMHFIGGKFSEYAIKTGYSAGKAVGREGNYYMETHEIKLWKQVSDIMVQKSQDKYCVIDWEKEENENLIWMGQIAEEKLPF